MRGEPAGYELREEPHALCLARLALREEPERPVQMEGGSRHPHQKLVGVADEAGQCRHPEPLPYRGDLRLGVRDPERNFRGGNVTRVCPVRIIFVLDDPADAIGRTPRGQEVVGHVDAAEQLRSFQGVKIGRQSVAVVDDADRDVGFPVGQIHRFF